VPPDPNVEPPLHLSDIWTTVNRQPGTKSADMTLCHRISELVGVMVDGLLQVEMTGSSILEYIHRMDQQEFMQQFRLTPPSLMTSSPTRVRCSSDDKSPADEQRAATAHHSSSDGL